MREPELGMQEWTRKAVCATVKDKDAWFAADGSERAEKARNLCKKCPVRAECLEFSLRPIGRGIMLSGMWGGLTEDERRKLMRRRGFTRIR